MGGGIGDIAKEVAKDLDIEKMFGNVNENSNPMEIMSQMMNPEKMGSIFNNINSVMEKKMESGELTHESLKSEAEGMIGKMGENPMFKNMMQGMQQGMPEQADNGNSTNPSQEKNDTPRPAEKELTREEKQQRLREKIKEKRDNR